VAQSAPYRAHPDRAEPAGRDAALTITIPADPANGTLAGSYTFGKSYTPGEGLLQRATYPATTGALPTETVSYGYNGMSQLSSVGGLASYTLSTSYDQWSHPLQSQLGFGTNTAWVAYT
jgi:hypothetical protein